MGKMPLYFKDNIHDVLSENKMAVMKSSKKRTTKKIRNYIKSTKTTFKRSKSCKASFLNIIL